MVDEEKRHIDIGNENAKETSVIQALRQLRQASWKWSERPGKRVRWEIPVRGGGEPTSF